jgi:hypothetical protein
MGKKAGGKYICRVGLWRCSPTYIRSISSEIWKDFIYKLSKRDIK